ncbi:MAG: glycerate kinase, partial [Prevotella sp.]|nr:glycerate kinase [Prevotella sp.]
LCVDVGVGGVLFDEQPARLHIVAHEHRENLIGIGGSATNDCGLGLLSVFELSIYDDKNNKLQPFGGEMHKAKKAIWQGGLPKDLLKGIELIIASDVDNNLYGKDGAAYVYARQKGCTPKDIETLDNGLRNIADLLAEYAENKQFHLQKGAGAAGGLGYALMLLGGEKWSGAELVLKANNLDAALRDADFVLTGEGKLDKQTLMGKAPFIVMQHGKAVGAKTFGIAGCVEDEESLTNAGFNKVFAITPSNLPLSEALQKETAKHNLTNCIKHLYTNYLTDL